MSPVSYQSVTSQSVTSQSVTTQLVTVGHQSGISVNPQEITHVTGCLVTCVCSNVSLQQPWAGEALAARRTLASLVVGPHVLAEGGRADVYLVTVRTLAGRPLVVRGAVRLPARGHQELWSRDRRTCYC